MISETGKETVTQRIPGEPIAIATASRPEASTTNDRPSPSIDEALKPFDATFLSCFANTRVNG